LLPSLDKLGFESQVALFFASLGAMIHSWLRSFLLGLVGLGAVLGLLFSYFCWWGPAARMGNCRLQQSYRVRPGMRAEQAFQLMGLPQQEVQRGREMVYIYPAHPFASSDIALVIGPGGVVTRISHGE
jgi:hypothetical protein